MPLLDHFGLIAPVYEFFIRPGEQDGLLALAGLPEPGIVLDAAGGTGRIAQALRKQTDQVVVVDLSLKMLRQAKEKSGLDLACAVTEKLPFPDGCFSKIVMVDALHHVEDHAQTAGEFWRVLKPGGRIIIQEPDIRSFAVKLVAIGEKLLLMRSHFRSPERIAKLFPGAGGDIRILKDSYRAYVIVGKAA